MGRYSEDPLSLCCLYFSFVSDSYTWRRQFCFSVSHLFVPPQAQLARIILELAGSYHLLSHQAEVFWPHSQTDYPCCAAALAPRQNEGIRLRFIGLRV